MLIREKLVKKQESVCLATNLYDSTMYNFRVRSLCQDPFLDPFVMHP